MIDRCTRCRRRLTGLFSTQVGIGPVCMRKAHQAQQKEANEAQADLFAGELVTAAMSSRLQTLLARVHALDARARKFTDVATPVLASSAD